MGMTEEGASYMVLDHEDMAMLEKVAERIINARGRQFIYQTDAGVRVTFDPPAQEKEDDRVSKPKEEI